MPEVRPGPPHLALIVSLGAVTLLVGLGASRLTYHEAIWATTAREMIASGGRARPDDRRPAVGGEAASGDVDHRGLGGPPRRRGRMGGEAPVRDGGDGDLPGGGVDRVQEVRGEGRPVAGLIQATMPWLVLRGRLAEADVSSPR